MATLTPVVCTWFSEHHGIASSWTLRQLGLTSGQLRHLTRAGVLQIEARNVYRMTAAPRTRRQAAATACAIADHVAVSHVTAGALWGLRRLGGDRALHVTIAGRSNRIVPGAVVHRSHRMDVPDVVERADGIRLTSPPRTAFDLAATLSDDAIGSIIEQLVHERLCTIPTLFDTARRLRERGRNGSARFARVLQGRPAFMKPVGSDLELRLERALVAAGLPRPERQAELRLPTGETVHPDFFWPAEREALEVDHVTWHGGKLDLTYDKRRDRQLWQIGVHVTRVTDAEIRTDLTRVVSDIEGILRRSRAA